MRKIKITSLVSCVALPAIAILLGIAPIRGYAENADCSFCHKLGGTPGARDLGQYYLNPTEAELLNSKFHFNHPIGKKYPTGFNASQEYNLPINRIAGITFFDKNGNGQPDGNEIQLFSEVDPVTGEIIDEYGDVTIECASCHIEHGNDPTIRISGSTYLRIRNENSEMCLICHSK